MKAHSDTEPPTSLAGLLSPVRRTIILACAIQTVGSASGVVPFIAVVEIARALLTYDAGATDLWSIAAVAAGAMLVRLLCMMAAGGLTHVADITFQHDLRIKLVNRLSHVPLGWFTDRSAGEVKKALQDDVTALHHLVGHGYTSMVGAIVTPIVALAYLVWSDWRVALAALGPVLLGVLLFALQMRGYGAKIADYNGALGRVSAASVAYVQGIAVIKTFGTAGRAFERFAREADAFVDNFWNWVRGLLVLSATTELVLSPFFGLTYALGIGLLMASFGWIGPVEVLAAAILVPGLTAPFLTLAFAQNEMMLARDAASRVLALLATPTLAVRHVQGAPNDMLVAFEDVSFSYDGKTDVLTGIDLTLAPGTTTALVGRSGSGKSTLSRLLPRFFDVTSGRILIGGVPVDALEPAELHSLMTFVFQETQLLSGTIRENIAIARPNAESAEIEHAARAARIHDRIVTLPRGYDTLIGGDVQLSGGEAQRVAIARAILKDAPILVLDEATAFADPDAEADIQDAIAALARGKTLLVVAHRLATIAAVDQICVIDCGRIVERGRHEDLLARGGLYAALWEIGASSDAPPSQAAQ